MRRRSTFLVNNSTVFYPHIHATGDGENLVSHAGTVLLARTAEVSGLAAELSTALAPWRTPFAVHDPGKIIADLAVALIVGGDCLADIATIRERADTFGQVASDPTVSRLISTLAQSPVQALSAIAAARATTPGTRVVAGWHHRAEPRHLGKEGADHRPRRHSGHRALR